MCTREPQSKGAVEIFPIWRSGRVFLSWTKLKFKSSSSSSQDKNYFSLEADSGVSVDLWIENFNKRLEMPWKNFWPLHCVFSSSENTSKHLKGHSMPRTSVVSPVSRHFSYWRDFVVSPISGNFLYSRVLIVSPVSRNQFI